MAGMPSNGITTATMEAKPGVMPRVSRTWPGERAKTLPGVATKDARLIKKSQVRPKTEAAGIQKDARPGDGEGGLGRRGNNIIPKF